MEKPKRGLSSEDNKEDAARGKDGIGRQNVETEASATQSTPRHLLVFSLFLLRLRYRALFIGRLRGD